MIDQVQDAVDRLADAYRRGSALVLLFDYDGTLTPIVEHPRLAVLDGCTRRLLADLASCPRVHVGILSGRELDELKSLVQVDGLYYSGTGGMEIELRGTRVVHPHAKCIAGMIERLAEHIESQLSPYQGAWIEKKRLGVTVHYRQLPDHLHASLQAVVADATRDFAGELRMLPGPLAWEITPTNGWNKGTAVRLILAHFTAADDMLFYAGDGANDAEAMQEVAAMGGMTVGVGPDAPCAARCRVPDQAAVPAILARLARIIH